MTDWSTWREIFKWYFMSFAATNTWLSCWTLCSWGSRNGQFCPGLANPDSNAGRAGDQFWEEDTGCRWAASSAGPRSVPRQQQRPGVVWAGHGIGCQGTAGWSFLLRTCQVWPGARKGVLWKNQRGFGKDSGMVGLEHWPERRCLLLCGM